MSAADAAALEQELKTDSHQPGKHLQLLHYYSAQRCSAARIRELSWFIENEPDARLPNGTIAFLSFGMDAQQYQLVKRKWQEQVDKNPQNPGILFNFASFLCLDDNARNLLVRALELAPGDDRFKEALGALDHINAI